MYRRATAAPRMVGFLSRRRGWWRLMVLGVIILILGSYISPVRTYLEKSSTIQREQAVTDELRSQRDMLQKEKDSLQNNNYVEQVARKDLGMVKPGEQPFVVKDLNTYEGESNTTVAPAEDASLVERVMEAIGSVLP